jgi:LCP family protein required for cell wall assembly
MFAIGWSAAGVLAVGNLRASGSGDASPGDILNPVAQATYILAAPDSTATPTPFQPLAPTSLASPTTAATEVSDQPTMSAPTVTLQPTPLAVLTAAPAIEKLPSQINLLLLGSDRRPWDAGFRTDTIILITINSEQGNVNVTSFPRDLWVMLPNWGMSRINTAWTYGGWNMMRDTFQHNFGVKIDYHILVDFSSFKKIVDGLGGLDIKVGETVSDYRAGYWITIKKGLQHMDADTVLWYSRTRKTTNDIARNRRQQEVLTALLDKFISIDAIRRAPELYDLYNNSVKTDITLVDVLRWLPFAAKFIETRNMHQYFITYKEVYDWITPEGAMVLVPNKDALMKVIRRSQNLK